MRLANSNADLLPLASIMPTPSEAVPPAMAKLVILSGPSGVGKSTIIERMRNMGFECVRSYTTRSMRAGESEGNPYHFISEEDFLEMQKAGEFLIGQKMGSNYYGARTCDFAELLGRGKSVVFDMDPRRIPEVKAKFPEAVSFVILPDSYDTLRMRMRAREKDLPEDRLEERMAHAQTMLTEVLGCSKKYADFCIPNFDGNLDATVDLIARIATAHDETDKALYKDYSPDEFKRFYPGLYAALTADDLSRLVQKINRQLPLLSGKKIKVVLTGAPCSGKTTTLNALKAVLGSGCAFVDEVATEYIAAQHSRGVNPFTNLIRFEETMLANQIEKEDVASTGADLIFCDRGMIDHLAICRMLKIGAAEGSSIESQLMKAASERVYQIVFILDRLEFIPSVGRRELDETDVKGQDESLRATYTELQKEAKFEFHQLPVLPVSERVTVEDSVAARVRSILDTVTLYIAKSNTTDVAVTAASRLGIFAKGMPASSHIDDEIKEEGDITHVTKVIA